MERLTRAERKLLKRKIKQSNGFSIETHGPTRQPAFKLQHISPKTKNQEKAFREFSKGQNLLVHGYPGTGKSFLSLYLALNEIESFKTYSKIILVRSVVPSRDIGYLPGSIKEKSRIYESPYVSICNELYGRGDAYDILTNKGIIEFHTSSFMRGMTFNDAIIIVDEAQNATEQELLTICTRIGDNSRLIVSGDLVQNDLHYKKTDITGLPDIMNILKRIDSVSHIEFDAEDIVRSGFVKQFILAKYGYESTNKLIV
jgi:phosphate starvation-inducible protein PhoH and related proteins